MALEWLAAPFTGLVQTVGNIVGAERQAKHNRALAAFQHSKNMELLKYQLDYNTPAMQMQRFKDAGLNPNLIYGQGNPGNMSSAPTYPDIRPSDYQGAVSGAITQMADLAIKANQAKLLETQADLNVTKATESTVKQTLMQAQRDLVKANPYMRPEYVNAMVQQLQSMANMKEKESVIYGMYMDDNRGMSVGQRKVYAEMRNLEQKFNLLDADKQIKAKVIESKEFQNELLRVQNAWMSDGEINSEHIRQFIMMFMNNLMR